MLRLDTPRRPLVVGHLLFDLDRTLTDENLRVVPEALEAIERARSHGVRAFLVTGRNRREMVSREALLPRFDGLVLESGGLVGTDVGHLQPMAADDSPIRGLAERLKLVGIDFEQGDTCLSLSVSDEAALDRHPPEGWTRHRNRDRIDVTPAGIDKGVGARRLLGQPNGHAAVAFADGENDRSLFEAVDYRVAVANAVPQLKEAADETTQEYGGHGVARFLTERLRPEVR